jgi:hypothetical protein
MKRMLLASGLLLVLLAVGGCHGNNGNAPSDPNAPAVVPPPANNFNNVPANAQHNLPALPAGSQIPTTPSQ